MKRHFLLLFLFCFALSLLDGQEAANRAPQRYKVVDTSLTGGVSFLGRLESFTDYSTGSLCVRDLSTGKTRVLARAGVGEGADYSAISADGKQIAYAWYNTEDLYELRAIGLDGSPPRVLYRDGETYFLEPRDWSSNGKQILGRITREKDKGTQIVLFSVDGGSPRVLKTFPSFPYGRMMSLSADGHYVAYDFPQQEDSYDRDIFLLPVDGSPEVRLVENRANDVFFGWTPDGTHILFASDRSGTWDLWMLAVADGRPAGEPELVKSAIGPALPGSDFTRDCSYLQGLGFTEDGSYYYGIPAWENDLYLATLDQSSGKLGPPEKLTGYLGFDTSAQWSPDGQSLAYVSWHGFEVGSFLLRIRSMETGQERRFPLKMMRLLAQPFQPHWSPDGSSLMAQGADAAGSQGIYGIEAKTGKVSAMLHSGLCPPDCIEWPVWSSDGKVIFARRTSAKTNAARRIVSRDLARGREDELYRALPAAQVSHLAVSPDARRVAFIEWDSKNRTTALKILMTPGGRPQELLRVQASETIFDLAWAPDNRQLLFGMGSTGKDQHLNLWRISTEGEKAQELGLAMQGLRLYGLSVSPDGKRIAFTAGTPLRGELWVLKDFLNSSERQTMP